MLLTTTARSWTKLPVGQTTKSRKIGCKYLVFSRSFFVEPQAFRNQESPSLLRNCSLFTIPAAIACKRGIYINCSTAASKWLNLSYLALLCKKCWLNFLNLGCFYPKSYSEINNIFLKYSTRERSWRIYQYNKKFPQRLQVQ